MNIATRHTLAFTNNTKTTNTSSTQLIQKKVMRKLNKHAHNNADCVFFSNVCKTKGCTAVTRLGHGHIFQKDSIGYTAASLLLKQHTLHFEASVCHGIANNVSCCENTNLF